MYLVAKQVLIFRFCVLLIFINNMDSCYLDMAQQLAEETYTTIPDAYKYLIYIPV